MKSLGFFTCNFVPTAQSLQILMEGMVIIMSRRKNNRTGIGIIVFVVLILFAIVSYSRIGLQKRYDEAQITIDRMDTQIIEQEERTLDINNLKAYVQTKKYIEDIAREKLGLVYEDEIIFEADDEN